jgi:hypothetical protein
LECEEKISGTERFAAVDHWKDKNRTKGFEFAPKLKAGVDYRIRCSLEDAGWLSLATRKNASGSGACLVHLRFCVHLEIKTAEPA